MNHLYIDIHVLQNVPPSNINRDDTGSPKQARYGGVNRARVSSQAWKRATRKEFWESVPSAEQSTRTKRIHTILSARIEERTEVAQEVAARVAAHALSELGLTADKKQKKDKAVDSASPETGYLLFFGLAQIERLVDDIVEIDVDWALLDDKETAEQLKGVSAKAHLGNGHPIDVALFGRMVADVTSLNVDASSQVAHAISTHEVRTEFDYFTAVDDEKAKQIDEDAGAGMIGTIEFNSATLYRYANVSFRQLSENLDGSLHDSAGAIGSFIDAFVRSMPTGKLNTFANRTLPSMVVVVLRNDQPVNLVGAFENPVRPGDGLVTRSAERLAQYFNEVTEQWAAEPSAVFANYGASLTEAVATVFGNSTAFPALVEAVEAAVIRTVEEETVQ